MQSTGQASTQAVSLVPMHGSAITYAIDSLSPWAVRNSTEPHILARMPPPVQDTAIFPCPHPYCTERGLFSHWRRVSLILWTRAGTPEMPPIPRWRGPKPHAPTPRGQAIGTAEKLCSEGSSAHRGLRGRKPDDATLGLHFREFPFLTGLVLHDEPCYGAGRHGQRTGQ